ncbi:hypothetical protein [Achromobacter sp.]|uniref:hypothetical protein n=1 Tax=Achromobacter sp. TaxID=134375 RepID=UPI00289BB791|nr:hypothetical protein [Achromobacter sp.]
MSVKDQSVLKFLSKRGRLQRYCAVNRKLGGGNHLMWMFGAAHQGRLAASTGNMFVNAQCLFKPEATGGRAGRGGAV